MKDVDGDDWGDDAPPAGVTAGTDCDDTDAALNVDATIALAEAVRAGKLHEEDLLCLVAFGAGFTWASALVDLCLPGRRHRW